MVLKKFTDSLIENLIRKFKYQPFVKELAKFLSFIIIEHLQLPDNKPGFADFVIIPIPVEKRKPTPKRLSAWQLPLPGQFPAIIIFNPFNLKPAKSRFFLGRRG